MAAVTRSWQPTLTGDGGAEGLAGQSVSGDYFRVLAVPPARVGTSLRPTTNRFTAGRDDHRRIVARGGSARIRAWSAATIRWTAQAVTIVGIMPRTFENVWHPQAQIWRPLGYDPSLPPQGREWGHHLQLIARVRSDSTLTPCGRELGSIARTPIARFTRPAWASLRRRISVGPAAGPRDGANQTSSGSGHDRDDAPARDRHGQRRQPHAGARGAERRTELVTCAALGASRGRLVTPLLGEGLVLALIGGALGVALAYAMVDVVMAFDGLALPRLDAIRVDPSALAFAAVLSTTIGVVAGCIPGFALSGGVTRRVRVHASSPGITGYDAESSPPRSRWRWCCWSAPVCWSGPSGN